MTRRPASDAATIDDLVVLATHARTVGASERSAFAARLRADDVQRGLVLETCHRVEWYGVVGNGAPHASAAHPTGGRTLTGAEAARHLIEVAVGLDSVIVGEDQILHQLRTAVAAARMKTRLDPALDRLLAMALQAGRRARSWQERPSRSLADHAIDALVARVGELAGRQVLVVGAGEMGRLALGAAHTAGARVAIASRTDARARSLVTDRRVTVVAFDPGAFLGEPTAIVVGLGGPWVLSDASADALVAGSSVMVDLSVPPAVGAGLAGRLGDRLISADDLASIDPVGAERSPARRRDEALVEMTLEAFRLWAAGRDSRAAAGALAERVERERRAELDDLWRRLPDLEPDSRAAIERMTQHLTERVLRDPLERLGDDTDGRHERAVRELWAL